MAVPRSNSARDEPAPLTWLTIAGGTALLYHVCWFVLHRLGSIVELAPGWWQLVTAACIAPLLVMPTDRRTRVAAAAASLAVFAAYAVIPVALPPLFDRAWDTYMYHLFGTMQLAEGWNIYAHGSESIWVDSYPSGFWALASTLVAASGPLFAAHAIALVLIPATGLFVAGALRASRAPDSLCWPRDAVAVLLIANPIVVTQLLTYYVDGLLYLYGIALAAASLAFARTGRPFYAVVGTGLILLMVNTKTSGLYFAPTITALGLVTGTLPTGRRLREQASRVLRLGLPFAAVFLLGVVVLGYRPFVTNVMDHDQLLYPGVDTVLRGQVPENLANLPAPAKFAAGLFARTGHIPSDNRRMVFKPPTFVTRGELTAMSYDTRGGGFGPFFPIAVLAWLGLTATAGWLRVTAARRPTHPERPPPELQAVVLSLGLMAICAVFPQPWWARYVPFAWSGVALGLLMPATGQGWLTLVWSRGLKAVLATALCGCVASAALSAGLHTVSYQTYITAQLEKLREAEAIAFYAAPQSTSEGHNHATFVWQNLLNRRGIPATVARHGTCPLASDPPKGRLVHDRLTARARYCARYPHPASAPLPPADVD